MHRYRMIIFSSVVIAILAALLIRTGGASVKAAVPSSCGGWSVVASPNHGADSDYLNGVAAVSANNVWAVGGYVTNGGPNSVDRSLIEHWNGSQWSTVTSLNVGKGNNDLTGVAVVSANDIWSVGTTNLGPPHYTSQSLIEHWNGTKWSLVSSPPPGGSGGGLRSISVISANDIWAVGNYNDNSATSHTLAEHWDGSHWTIVPSPDPASGGNYLEGVTVISSNNVWAVGGSFTTGPANTLIEHWDGTVWSVVSSPNPGLAYNALFGVTSVSANDIWAVGNEYNRNVRGSLTLIEHWNGTAWSVVSSPSLPSQKNFLASVSAMASNNVWAVGYAIQPDRGPGQTVIEHWNGSQWSIVASPNPGSGSDQLFGVTFVPATSQVWSVGVIGLYYGKTLTEYYC